jgi:hypothetical protein
MKKLSAKKLASLEIEVNETGFCVWIISKNKSTGTKTRYWILDGSLIREDGTIRFGSKEMYSINAVYNEEKNIIEILKSAH